MKVSSPEARRLAERGELPPNSTVGSWLDLSGTQITALPDGLSVGGGLYLSGTQITELPDGLSVGGHLWVEAPATYLDGADLSKIKGGVRPIESDREYWAKRLDIDLSGCWDDIFRRVAKCKRRLLQTTGIQEWEKVVIRNFRG